MYPRGYRGFESYLLRHNILSPDYALAGLVIVESSGGTMRSPKTCLFSFLCLESVPLSAQNNAPECRITPGVESPLQGNAGCLVKIDNKMLMVRHRETAKLSPPGGTAVQQETAQCTAHRETWEETGVEVRVGTLLKNVNQQLYLFFLCYHFSN